MASRFIAVDLNYTFACLLKLFYLTFSNHSSGTMFCSTIEMSLIKLNYPCRLH
jgi:hypothetical protein